jgi:hypothetical protein
MLYQRKERLLSIGREGEEMVLESGVQEVETLKVAFGCIRSLFTLNAKKAKPFLTLPPVSFNLDM